MRQPLEESGCQAPTPFFLFHVFVFCLAFLRGRSFLEF